MNILELMILVFGWAGIFFIMALIETKNIKEAFYKWIETLVDWKEHAIPGIIFLIILLIVCNAIGN